MRVLVLDDQPNLRQLVKIMLFHERRILFDVAEAASFTAALEFIQDPVTRPHVLMLDLHLGGGFDPRMIRELRERANVLDLPIIVLAGRGSPDDVLRARMAGADAVLPKPFSGRDLVPLVARLAAGSDRRVALLESAGIVSLPI